MTLEKLKDWIFGKKIPCAKTSPKGLLLGYYNTRTKVFKESPEVNLWGGIPILHKGTFDIEPNWYATLPEALVFLTAEEQGVILTKGHRTPLTDEELQTNKDADAIQRKREQNAEVFIKAILSAKKESPESPTKKKKKK